MPGGRSDACAPAEGPAGAGRTAAGKRVFPPESCGEGAAAAGNRASFRMETEAQEQPAAPVQITVLYIRIRKAVPFPRSLDTVISPCCWERMLFAIARPMPTLSPDAFLPR